MPAGPDETDNHQTGSITEQIAKNPSSKTDSQASEHHHHKDAETGLGGKGDKVQFRQGPVQPDTIDAKEEGTKDERKEKAQQMNSVSK